MAFASEAITLVGMPMAFGLERRGFRFSWSYMPGFFGVLLFAVELFMADDQLQRLLMEGALLLHLIFSDCYASWVGSGLPSCLLSTG